MNFNDFYAKVTDKFSYSSKWDKNVQWYHGDEENYTIEWHTGGASGGNCWGGEASYRLDSEPVPELDMLDEFLEEICPTMSFFQYKRIMKDLVTYDSRTSYEYYGNYDNYSSKSVNYRMLYDRLVDIGLLIKD